VASAFVGGSRSLADLAENRPFLKDSCGMMASLDIGNMVLLRHFVTASEAIMGLL
jgi:hypothetical protein